MTADLRPADDWDRLAAQVLTGADDNFNDWRPPDVPDLYQFQPGGAFILDTPADPKPLWGLDDRVILADGEALLIAGPQGTGKTTLAQQLTLGRVGIPEFANLLGMPISSGQRRVLYLAMDRPRQAARSLRRMG